MDLSENPKSREIMSLYQEVQKCVFLDAFGFGNITPRISEDTFLYVQRAAKEAFFRQL